MPPNRPATLRQLDHFAGWRERPRHVEESGAQPERAVFHPLLDERAHLLQLVGGRLAIELADDARTDAPLPDEGADVDGFLQRLELRQKRAERHWRRPIGTFDQRGHPLPDIVVSGRNLKDAARRVGVNVDESRRQHLAGGVDRSRRGLVDGRRDARDGIPADGKVGTIPGAPGAIDDASVAEQQVVGRRLSGRPGRTRDGRNRRGQEHSRPAVPSSQAVRSIGHASPESLQKREEVSVTSARAHAFFSRCSTRAASSLLPCATSAWCTPKSAHPFSRLRRRSSQ